MPTIGLTCEDIECVDNQECVLQSFVERNITYSQCVISDNIPQLMTMSSCAATQCPEGTVCIDLRFGDLQVTAQCLVTNCTNSTVCSSSQSGAVCALVPDEFGFDNIRSVCSPGFSQSEFGTETCEQSGRVCPSPTVCQDAFVDGIVFGTLCDVNQLNTDCSQVSCIENEECVTTTLVSNSQTIAICFQNSTFPPILQLLEALGLVESTPTTQQPNSTFMQYILILL